MIRVGILIINDQSALGEREDESGPTIQSMLPEHYEIVHYKNVPEELSRIEEKLIQWTPHCDIILTSGATGLTVRDIAPEATLEVIDFQVPGIAEAIRSTRMQDNPQAMLSRAVAGVRERTLIINLPGSPEAVRQGLNAVLPTLGFAVEKLRSGVKV